MSSNTKYPNETRKALKWFTSHKFASIYSNALPGFFSLSKHKISVKDALANEFLSWRKKCDSTIRSTYQVLSRGFPNLEDEVWIAVTNVVNGAASAEEMSLRLQRQLESWYPPQQRKFEN